MIERLPSKERAEQELLEASQLNPGPWVGHSKNTGYACQYIAEKCPDLNPEKAYIIGLLHDIGRRGGIMSVRHIIDGYRYCMAQGWEDAARGCMTHSFMIKNVDSEIGVWDISNDDREMMKQTLDSITYNDYDRLLQLCDSLALDSGFCLLEKRFVDVTRRYGVCKYTVARWNAVFEIKEYFEKIIGKSIYDILPDVKENTFRDLKLWRYSCSAK